MQQQKPFISIIVPFYNRRYAIGRAIESIKNQEYKDFEIIAVDDGSTDGGDKFIRKNYPEVYLIHFSENRGVGAARNVGIKAAQGEIVTFLDSDDEWKPDYLKEQVTSLVQGFSSDLSFTDVAIISNTGETNNTKFEPSILTANPIAALLVGFSFIFSVSCVAVRKNIFEKIGYFNEKLKSAEDRDFYIRILKASGRFAHISKTLVLKYNLLDGLTAAKNTKYLYDCILLLQLFISDNNNSLYQSYAMQGLYRRTGDLLEKKDVSLLKKFWLIVALSKYKIMILIDKVKPK